MKLILLYLDNSYIIDYCPQCRGEIDKIAHVQNKYEDAHYRKIVMGEMMMTLPQ
jgi:hypothetical protein